MSSLLRMLLMRRMSSASSKIPSDKSSATKPAVKNKTETAPTTEVSSASGLTEEEVTAMVEDTKTRIRTSTNDFYRDPVTKDIYLNPDLSPPPRSPQQPEDFRHPQKLGHWVSYGFDWTNPVADKYKLHEAMAVAFLGFGWVWFFWFYSPDYKLLNWTQREAFIRMHRREALGQPLISRDFVDPERIVLPSEEELKDFPVII